MLFYSPKLFDPFLSFPVFHFFLFLSIGWYCGAGVIRQIICKSLSPSLSLPTSFHNNNTAATKKAMNLPKQRWISRFGKIQNILSNAFMGNGYNLESYLRDAVGSLKNDSSAFGTVYYLNLCNTVPNCPNSYAPQHTVRTNKQWTGGKGQFITLDL